GRLIAVEDTGRVDQDAERAELAHGGRDGPIDVVPAADVRLGERRAPDARAAAGDDRAAAEQAHVPRNSAMARAARSGASSRTMWPPGKSRSAAPLTRRCHS